MKCCTPKASSGMGTFDMGDMFGGSGTTPPTAPTAPPGFGFDVGDMFGGSGATLPTVPPPHIDPIPRIGHLDDMFGGSNTIRIPGMPGPGIRIGGDGTPASAAAAHSNEPPAALCPDAPSNLDEMMNGRQVELKKRGGCGAS